MIEHPQNCRELFQTISDYVDGSLASDLCTELERHLQDCQNCRVVVDTLRKTIDLYHTTNPVAEIPAEVRERLYVRLQLDDFCD
jgi:anti-sigma factor RsiW